MYVSERALAVFQETPGSKNPAAASRVARVRASEEGPAGALGAARKVRMEVNAKMDAKRRGARGDALRNGDEEGLADRSGEPVDHVQQPWAEQR